MEAVARRLTGKNALVTGAARRIGRAISLALAREGANVALHYSSSEREIAELAAEIEGLGLQAVTLRADLSDPAELVGLVERARDALGKIEILVNNASIFPSDTLETIAIDAADDFRPRLSSGELQCSHPDRAQAELRNANLHSQSSGAVPARW